jgi:hypothetical protein
VGIDGAFEEGHAVSTLFLKSFDTQRETARAELLRRGRLQSPDRLDRAGGCRAQVM